MTVVSLDRARKSAGVETQGEDRRDRVREVFARLDRAAADPRLSGSDFRAYYVIQQRDGQRLSQKRLGALAGGLGARMIRNITGVLAKLAYISVTPGRGPNTASRYHVQLRQRIAASEDASKAECGKGLPHFSGKGLPHFSGSGLPKKSGSGLPTEEASKEARKKKWKRERRASAPPPSPTPDANNAKKWSWQEGQGLSDYFIDLGHAYRTSLGLPRIDLQYEASKFVDRWLADSSPQAYKTDAGWKAAWRSWCRKAEQFDAVPEIDPTPAVPSAGGWEKAFPCWTAVAAEIGQKEFNHIFGEAVWDPETRKLVVAHSWELDRIIPRFERVLERHVLDFDVVHIKAPAHARVQ